VQLPTFAHTPWIVPDTFTHTHIHLQFTFVVYLFTLLLLVVVVVAFTFRVWVTVTRVVTRTRCCLPIYRCPIVAHLHTHRACQFSSVIPGSTLPAHLLPFTCKRLRYGWTRVLRCTFYRFTRTHLLLPRYVAIYGCARVTARFAHVYAILIAAHALRYGCHTTRRFTLCVTRWVTRAHSFVVAYLFVFVHLGVEPCYCDPLGPTFVVAYLLLLCYALLRIYACNTRSYTHLPRFTVAAYLAVHLYWLPHYCRSLHLPRFPVVADSLC